MFSMPRVKYFQFLEHWYQKGFWSACGFTLYHKEEEVPVVRDLSNIPPLKVLDEGLTLIEVTPENVSSQNFQYPLRSRRERVEPYLQKGYCALAMVQEGQAYGDLWYVSQKTARTEVIHPDIQRFKIDFSAEDVYLFDMHVDSKQRRGGLATFLLSSALHHLHNQKYCRAFGYYAADNIPALWVHRLLGYQELPPVIVRRYFLHRTTHPKE